MGEDEQSALADLARALAWNRGVSATEETLRQFLDQMETKTKELVTKLHGRLEAEDVQAEALTWVLEGGLNKYRANRGDVWGYAFESLLNRLVPDANLVRAPMARQRDRESTRNAKRGAHQPFTDIDSREYGDYRWEPLEVLLQQERHQELHRCCAVSLAILDGDRPQKFGDRENRKDRIYSELDALLANTEVTEEQKEVLQDRVKEYADSLSKKRGPRGNYRGKKIARCD